VEGYTTPSAAIKSLSLRPYPVPVWSYARRVARTGASNPNFRSGRYTRLRHKVEIGVRGQLRWMQGAYAKLAANPRLTSQLVELGPVMQRVHDLHPEGSWGIPCGRAAAVRPERRTPYLVPRRATGWARAFIRAVRELAVRLRWLLAMMPRVSPPYLSGSAGRERDSGPERYGDSWREAMARAAAKVLPGAAEQEREA